MKSYQESGGTSLSTVWSDVKSKTFVPEPPEGMEAKKY
jgi:suppressor of G2 allele of SKP1